MNRSKRQVVFITGASSGIGAALAEEYAKEDFDLILAARRLDKLLVISESCQKLGAHVLIVKCDVRQTTDLEHALQESLNRFGKVDILIANAGFGVAGSFSKLQIEDYRRQFETNVFGVIHSIKIFLPEILKNKGRIGIMGSVSSFISLGEGSPYAMSKFAVRAFAESLYYELKPKGVSVTLIAPGFVESEIRLVNNKGKFREHAKDKDLLMKAAELDAGFMMNSQEIETAMRIQTPIVILIWNDETYSLIKWKQNNKFKRSAYVDFKNPDFLLYAQSFGAKSYRVKHASELLPILKQAIEDKALVLIDCPVDYQENLRLTKRLGELLCPI